MAKLKSAGGSVKISFGKRKTVKEDNMKVNKLGVANSLWNNIRAKAGSGKKPTPEMLEQERKIKAKEKK